MTGYGRATRSTAKLAVTVEVRTVNAKHLGVRCRLPGDWVRLEPRVEATVRGVLSRGTVDLSAKIEVAAGARRPVIDEETLAVYRKVLDDLGGGDGSTLLRLPGVVSLTEQTVPERTVERTVLGAAKDALSELVIARQAEGLRLVKSLGRELASFCRHLTAIRGFVPGEVRRHQETLHRRIATLLDDRGLALDDPILLREVALLADKGDVTEELDRLDSHVTALRGLLEGDGPVGRELDFLLQEIGREVNTVGSKSSAVSITQRVVQLKTCVDRLREQVANIE
ncbi:MAG: hypothetical protein ACI9EF_001696 [Pseudohongiellaceae bacterium]|jgi:uncharacterized protein (TIGR00255 family)